MKRKLKFIFCILVCIKILFFDSILVPNAQNATQIDMQVIPITTQESDQLLEEAEKEEELDFTEQTISPTPLPTPIVSAQPEESAVPDSESPTQENDGLYEISSLTNQAIYDDDIPDYTYYDYTRTVDNVGVVSNLNNDEIIKIILPENGFYRLAIGDDTISGGFRLYNNMGICIGNETENWVEVTDNQDGYYIYEPIIQEVFLEKDKSYYLYHKDCNSNSLEIIKESSGDGSYSYPFIIQTSIEFMNIKDQITDEKQYYILADDLDFSNIANYDAIGTDVLPFNGEIDGNYHTIKNLTINKTNAALFNVMSSNSIIKNLKISNSSFTGTNVASFAINGLASNCWSSARLKSTSSGRVYGVANMVQSCAFDGTIESTNQSAQIYGIGENVSNSIFEGTIDAASNEIYSIGATNVYKSFSCGTINDEIKYEYFDDYKVFFESDADYLSSTDFYNQLDSSAWIQHTYKNPFPQLRSIYFFNDITLDDWTVDGSIQYWLYNAMLQSFGKRWEHIQSIEEVTNQDLFSCAPLVLDYSVQDLTSKKIPFILTKLAIHGDLTIDFEGLGLKGNLPQNLGRIYAENSDSSLCVNLSNNKLSGQVPSGLLAIPIIEEMNLSNNYFVEPITEYLDLNINLDNNFFTEVYSSANISSSKNFDAVSGYKIVQKTDVTLNVGNVYRWSDLIEVQDSQGNIVEKDLSPLRFLFDNDDFKCYGQYFIPCKPGYINGNYYADVEGDRRNLTAAISVYVSDYNMGVNQIDIQTGNEFTVMLTPENKVFACGNNRKGQIGIGSSVYTIEDPVEITSQFHGDRVVKIAVGHSHSLALTDEGQVYAWGNNEYGQLGAGNRFFGSFCTSPLNITGGFSENNIVDIFTNGDTSYAISENGKVYAWGYNNYGQVGDNSTMNRETPIEITQKFGTERIVSLVPGGYFCFALGESGKVFSWGANTLGQLGNGSFEDAWQPQDITNVFADINIKKLSAGMHHAILLTEENEAYGWGDNRNGQLGDANDTYSISPRRILQNLPNGIVDIYVGSRSGMVKTIDGSLYAFGDNRYGQLCDGSNIQQSSPELISNQLNGDMPANVQIGMFHTFITGTSGAIYSAGYGKYGQLANGTVEDRLSPQMVDCNTPYFYSQTLSIINRQPVILSMDTTEIEYQIRNMEGKEYNSSDFYYFSSDDSVIDVDSMSGRVMPKKNGQAIIYLLPKDKISYLDASQYIETNLCLSMRVQCGSANYQLQAGNAHTVLLTDNNEVFTWGNNRYRQLGAGTEVNQELLPQNITSLFSGNKIVNIQSGIHHVLALSENGDLFAWGYNAGGQIGNGTQTNQNIPLNITDKFNGEKIKKIAAGGNQSFAITQTDKVYAWGANAYGQIGNGTTSDCLLPTDITQKFPETIVDIYAGVYFTFAKSETGKIYAFGLNNQGQLCTGSYENKTSPIEITSVFSGESIEIIAGGMHHAIAIATSGKVFTWGYNDMGQIGNNTTVRSNVPVEITHFFAGKSVSAVSCGTKNTSAVCSDGSLYLWGSNASGQLGLNDKSNRKIPTLVSDLSELNVKQVKLGNAHGILLTYDNKIYTCGQNLYGQLGDGTTLESLQFAEITEKFIFTPQESSEEVPYTLLTQAGNEYLIVLNVQNMKEIHQKEFIVRYNASRLNCQDLCAMTEPEEQSQGSIANTKIIITELSDGMIKFRYQEEIPEDQTFSGIINLIRFRAMTTGSTTVTVEIDEGGSEI